MDMSERWKQRFENYSNAYGKLNMCIDSLKKDPGNEITQMALIQAFEFCF